MAEGSRGPKKARGASFLLHPLLARCFRLSLLSLFPDCPLLSALSLFLVSSASTPVTPVLCHYITLICSRAFGGLCADHRVKSKDSASPSSRDSGPRLLRLPSQGQVRVNLKQNQSGYQTVR